MDRHQTLKVLASYEARLVSLGVTPVRVEGDRPSPSHEILKGHALWMVGRIREMLVGDVSASDFEKTMRWLGFVQCALWAAGVFTINEMKEHNR
jgi:hypothetical protein